jgi:polysaccharide biosynthesis transport protein
MSNPISNNSMPAAQTALSPFPQRKAAQALNEGPRWNISVLDSLKRHWTISIPVSVLMLAIGGFILVKKSNPVYSSHSVVYVSPKFPKLLSGDSELDRPYDSYVQDEVHTVTRYDIIADAIAKLPYSIRHKTGPASPQEVQQIQNALVIGRIGSTYQVSIGLTGRKPEGLAETVNAVTDTYLDKAKNEEFYGRDERLNSLKQQKERLQKELDARMAEQAQLMQELGIAKISETEGTGNPNDIIRMRLGDELATARMQREAAEAQLAMMLNAGDAGLPSVLEGAADQAIAADPGLSSVRTTLNARRLTLVAEMRDLKPGHPIYQRDRDELASIDAQINDLRMKTAATIKTKLRAEVTRTRAIELQLSQELAQQIQNATSAIPKFQKVTDLGSEIDRLQKGYAAVDERIRDLELESNAPGSVHMFSRALPPLGPEKSKFQMYVAVLLCCCLISGISIPVVIDLLDSRIYTANDVERVLGFHPIGVLLKEDEFSSELASEYYFRLAAGIDQAIRTAGARTFVFTSLATGNGTSTIVERLSKSLNSLHIKTLTITASGVDGRGIYSNDSRPRFDLALRGRAKQDKVQPALFALHSEVSEQEIPDSNFMSRASHQSDKKYDAILIDANPLLFSANTEYLARIADATVLILESSTAKKQQLHRAARLLERLDVPGVAVVLNKIGLERADQALRYDLREYEQRSQQKHNSSDRKHSLRQRPTAVPEQTEEQEKVETI